MVHVGCGHNDNMAVTAEDDAHRLMPTNSDNQAWFISAGSTRASTLFLLLVLGGAAHHAASAFHLNHGAENTATSLPESDKRRVFLAKTLAVTSIPFLLGGGIITVPTSSALANEIAGPPPGVAIYAYRSGGLPSLRPLGLTKLLTRYEGYVVAPTTGYPKSRTIPISFNYPSDWLQLDKLGGGIQYVDQRNGDKLYVLHATLPTDNDDDTTQEEVDLQNVNKQWFANVILNPAGDVVRSGVVAEGGRISRSQMIVDCDSSLPAQAVEDGASTAKSDAATTTTTITTCIPRRRLILKYDTVTGSGVQTVERRGLIDAYQVGPRDVYMILTTSNAVKFEQKGGSKERETVDNIVSSFKVGVGAFA